MRYRFGPFELDTSTFELRRDGTALSVEPKVYDLIRFLATEPGRLISKDALIGGVWDGRHVSDSAVTTCIKAARRALGDSGTSQTYIRTVRGRGVQFTAKVEIIQDTGEAARLPDMRKGSVFPDMPSIAVLPFLNLSAQGDEDYFAAGLTEEIIANLSRYRELFVYCRSTMDTLSRGGAKIGDLRQLLRVNFVIEGSVRKSPNAVRVTFRLVDAETEGHLLVEQLERSCTPDGVFQIQNDIAMLIAGRIANRRGPAGAHPAFAVREGRSKRWETYNWITAFYQYLSTRDAGLHRRIRDGLPNALEVDPSSSDGWAALSVVLLDEYRMHINERHGYPALEEALDHAKRAVSADPQNAFAYQARAVVLYHMGRFEEFRGDAEASLHLNPGRAESLTEFAQCFYLRGEVERALGLLDRAIEINPFQNGPARLIRAGCLFVEDRLDEALVELTNAPMEGFFWYHAYLVAVYSALGDRARASEEAKRMLELYPDFEANLAEDARIMRLDDQIARKFEQAWSLTPLS